MHCLNTAWEQHAAELRSWLLHRLGQAQDADDMMQDLYLKALQQGNRFCEILNTRAWLFQVARNAVADRMRVKREMVELPEDLPSLSDPVEAVDNLIECLPRVLSELSAEDRAVIVLCDLQGLPQKAYAAQAGITLSATKSRLLRARQRLRQRMTQACQVQFDEVGRVDDFVPRSPIDPKN